MRKAINGDAVKVHYTGRLNDGTVFDSSEGRDPLEFNVGSGSLIPGFESAVIDMEPGETKTVKIVANDAYGSYREDLIFEMDKEGVKDDMEVAVGMTLDMVSNDGKHMLVLVKEVKGSTLILDANHPMAGKDLTFDIMLEQIV